MWSSILLEIIFRVIPECMLFIFAGYTFSKYRIQIKRYLLSALLLSVMGYIIARLLPIEFGISQILTIITCAALLLMVNHIPIQKAIGSALGVMILGFVTEIISVMLMAMYNGISFITMFSNKDLFNSLFKSDLERQLYGLLPLFILAIILFALYFIAKAKGNLKDVPSRKSVE